MLGNPSFNMRTGASRSGGSRAAARASLRPARLLLATCLTGAACSPGPQWAGAIEVRNGATYVSNPADGRWADAELPPLRFELEQVYGSESGPPETLLGRARLVSFDVDARSTLYVLDGDAPRLVAFGADGVVLWAAGRAGSGPGELDDFDLGNPGGIAVSDKGTIVVLTHNRTRLDLWTDAGEYLDTSSLAEDARSPPGPRPRVLAGFVAADTVVLSGSIASGIGVRVTPFGLWPPRRLAEIVWDQAPDVDTLPGNWCDPETRAADGEIMIGSYTGYRFRIYRADGSLQREVTRDVDYPPRCGYPEHGGVVGFGSLAPPMRLPSGHLLVSVGWADGIDDPDAAATAIYRAMQTGNAVPADPRFASLDLFDPDGRFLYSVVEEGSEPSIGAPQFVGPDGRLYTKTDDPFPQIRRYRVEIADR